MTYYIQKRDGLWSHHLNYIKSIMMMLTVPFYTVLNLNKECYSGFCTGKFEFLSAHMWNVVADMTLASVAHLI